MVCDFVLCQLGDDHYALRMKQDIVANSAAVFGKYIVFSKAELKENNDEWQTFACWGEQICERLLSIFPELPQEQYGSILGDGFSVVQIDTAGTQFECFIHRAVQPNLIEKLTTEIRQCNESVWQSLQIGTGVGRIQNATVETFIPQMLNYDITGHISFTKGCYTGQEVVARLHYRGKPKRRTYLGSIAGEDVPIAGTPLFTPGNDQSIGNIVNASGGNDQDVTVLYCATATAIDQGVRVGSDQGMEILPGDLPYPMSQETKD